MARPPKYSPELRERAVRLVLDHAADHQWAAIRSVAEKLGCSVEALRAGFGRPNAMLASAQA